MRYLLPLLLLLPSLVNAQAIEPADPALGRKVDFYQDLFPVFEAKCLACHNVKDQEGALSLESVPAILKGGDSGVVVVAGKPDESLLVKLVARADEPAMPPLPNSAQAKSFTPRELGILRQWIQEGATAGSPPPASTLGWLPVPKQTRAIHSLALSPNGQFIAAGRANRVVLFDTATKAEVASLTDPALLSVMHNGAPMYGAGESHRDFVHAVAFSPDGDWLASAGYRIVKLWRRQSDQELNQWDAGQPVSALAVNAEGSLAATGQADGSIRLWDLATSQPGATLTGHTGGVRGLGFSPDGSKLYSTGDDKSLRQWTIADAAAAGQLGLPNEATALLVSKDGTLIVTAQADNKLLVWDASAVAPAAEQPAEETTPAAEGDQPAAEAAPAPEPPKPVREIGGHGQPVTQLLLVPGGDEFLTACRDGNVRLVNLMNGQVPRAFNIGSPVLAMTLSADAERIAAVAENGVGRIWNRANGQQLAEFKGDPALAGASYN
ncbi:MAG: c-type cytochrome domain-containing protein [Planctomycetaceae bacterium]